MITSLEDFCEPLLLISSLIKTLMKYYLVFFQAYSTATHCQAREIKSNFLIKAWKSWGKSMLDLKYKGYKKGTHVYKEQSTAWSGFIPLYSTIIVLFCK